MAFNYYRLYKAGRYCHTHKLRMFESILKMLKILLYPSTDIPFSVEMGENCYFPHRAIGVVIHEKAVIGRNVKIEANVCIGGRFNKGIPTIGDNVLIGTGAIILGGVEIGDDAIIGAGSVVLHDVKERCVVVGNPAHVLKEVDEETIGKPKK